MITAEGVGVFGTQVGLDAAQGEVLTARRRLVALFCFGCCHRSLTWRALSRETKWALPPRPFVLAVNADAFELAGAGFDEFFRLHEHAAGTAGVAKWKIE